MKMSKMKGIVVSALFVCIWLWNAEPVFALTVSPGAFSAQNVEPGEDKDTGIDLVITNDTDKEREFSVKVVKPQEAQDESLRGYEALPDLDWFRLERTNVTVGPHGQGRIRLFINIPAGDRFLNQHWIVSCLIEYIGQKSLFQEAIATTYMIETRAKADVTETPYGSMGIAPSVIKVPAETAGKEKPRIRIYNNTSEERTYAIRSFVPKEKKGRLEINATPGLVWAKKTSWIRPLSKKVKVAAGSSKEVELEVKVPKKEVTKEKGVEGLIFIDSDKKERRFVRVQVE